MPLLAALLPILGPLLAGSTLPAAVGAVSLTQWITLGTSLLSAAPEEINALNALSPNLTPFFSKLASDVKSAKIPHAAAASAVTWLAQAHGESSIFAPANQDR